MSPFVFISGMATGAAALLAASLWDSKRTEAQYSPLLKSPATLDDGQVVEQLNSYFFKAQKLYAACNEIELQAGELISTPIWLPDDSLLQKGANLLGGGANRYCRKWREGQLAHLSHEAVELFGRYQGVFKQAIRLLEKQDKPTIDLSAIKFEGNLKRIDSSLENDNWDREFGELADSIRNYLEKSCDAAQRLLDLLENYQAAPAEGAFAEQPI